MESSSRSVSINGAVQGTWMSIHSGGKTTADGHIHAFAICIVIDLISFSPAPQIFAKEQVAFANFHELHVYLSQDPCGATMRLMKTRSLPAELP